MSTAAVSKSLLNSKLDKAMAYTRMSVVFVYRGRYGHLKEASKIVVCIVEVVFYISGCPVNFLGENKAI